MITVHDLSPNVEVWAEPAPPDLPDALAAEVAALWEKDKARRGVQLFDGLMFSVTALAPARIAGHFVPYRWLVAQRARPALAASLKVRSLAVSGLIAAADGVVFGRRAAWLTDDAGCWELIPSGGIDPESVGADGRVDLRRQLLAELAEEVGLGAEEVTVSEPFCAVENEKNRVLDIGFMITTGLSKKEVRARQARLRRPEYAELAVVAAGDIPAFVASRGAALVEISRAILGAKGLL